MNSTRRISGRFDTLLPPYLEPSVEPQVVMTIRSGDGSGLKTAPDSLKLLKKPVYLLINRQVNAITGVRLTNILKDCDITFHINELHDWKELIQNVILPYTLVREAGTVRFSGTSDQPFFETLTTSMTAPVSVNPLEIMGLVHQGKMCFNDGDCQAARQYYLLALERLYAIVGAYKAG